VTSGSFLAAYLEDPTPPVRQVIEPPFSVQHAVWLGIDERVAVMKRAQQAITPLVAEGRAQELAPELITVMAELTGQELSCQHLAHRLHLPPYLILRLMAALELEGIWYHMQAFDRVAELVDDRSKGYMRDASVACSLLGVTSPEEITVHRSWGALFETFIVSKIKQQVPEGARVFFWRTRHGSAEVDVIIQYKHRLYPVEIKSAQHVSVSNARKIEIFTRFYEGDFVIAPGLIVYSGDLLYSLDNGCIAVPWSLV